MRFVAYGSSSLLVSDAASAALMDYAAIVTSRGVSDLVQLPVIDQVGCSAPVQVLLAPGIPLMSEAAPDDVLEPDDDEFVAEVRVRTAALSAGASRAV